MKKGFLLLILIFCCTSCATILTGKRSRIQIHTNKNVQLIVEGDTIDRAENKPVYMEVRNNKHPLPIVVKDGSNQQFLAVGSHKPFTYWLNAIPIIYFTGFLVDEISGRKWRYPRKIYIESNESGISFLPYMPMDSSLLVRKNKINFTPLSLVNGYHPAWEFGYERLHGTSRATQVSVSLFRSWNNDFARNSKGFKLGLEEKFFFRSQDRMRVYGSLSLEYWHKEHDALLNLLVVDAQGDPAIPWRTFSRLTTIRKQFIGIVPRIGIQQYITPRLVLEGYFGVGFRARKVQHLNRSPFTQHEDDFDWFFTDVEYLSNRETKNITPNFDLNFRIAWVF